MALSTKVDFIKDRFDPFTEIYSPNNISDEQHTIPATGPFCVRPKEVPKEDAPSSLEIWTGAGKTGDQFTEVSSAPGVGEFQVDWKFQSGWIRFNEADANTGIYITYKGLGDIIQAAHMNAVQEAIVPDGAIVMWSGLLANIPAGWHLCDGTSGTPDLRDKFILGTPAGVNPGDTGGAHSVALSTANLPAHTHGSAGNHAHDLKTQGSLGSEDNRLNWIPNVKEAIRSGLVQSAGSHTHSSVGSGTAHENRPAYFKLAYIMKL